MQACGSARIFQAAFCQYTLIMDRMSSPDYRSLPDAPLLFTDAAAAKVNELIAEEGNPRLALRVYIQGGGCSGFQSGIDRMEISK